MLLRNLLNDFEMLGEVFGRSGQYPPVQLYSNKDHLLLLAEVPGISEKELDVSVSEDVVTISGTKQSMEVKGDQSRLIHSERWSGSFNRKIELPFEVEGDQINASLKDGLLTIAMPIKTKSKPKNILIQGE